MELVKFPLVSALVYKFLLFLIVSFSNTFYLLSVPGTDIFTTFCGNWLIESEITIGEPGLFLSEDLKLIFVVEAFWFELIEWESFKIEGGLTFYWVTIVVGLKVYATNEFFYSATYFLLSGDISISIDCFSWSDWRNDLPLLIFDETTGFFKVSIFKVWIVVWSIYWLYVIF